MRTHILTAVLAVGGLAVGADRADAQGYFPPWAGPYRYPSSYYRPGVPVGANAFGGQDVAFVRSLYNQYLQREPDPQGLNTWVSRLAQTGGNTGLVTQEFLRDAQVELQSNNPYYLYRGYP